MRMLTLTRAALGAAVGLCVASIAVYPGGTFREPSVARYSWSQNFLSDLGMTVTHGGRPNWLGAALFTASFALLALSFAACAVAFVRLHASSAAARGWARAAGIGAVVVAAALLGAAVSPVDRATALHVTFARLASAVAPVSVFLFGVAAARDARFPRSVAGAWATLAAACGAWFAMRWGPGVDSKGGLAIHVAAQKLVAVAIVGVLVYQLRQASAVAAKLARAPTSPSDGSLQPVRGGRMGV